MSTETFNPSPYELACLLIAVGSIMRATGACAPAVMGGMYDDQIIEKVTSLGVSIAVARKLLRCELTEVVTQTWEH